MRSEFAQTIAWRGRRRNWGELELVWSNQRFSHPLDPICHVLQRARPTMLCNMLGKRSSNRFAIGVFERSPPHLFLYLLLLKEKQYKQGLCRFWITGESNFYWGKMHEMLKRLSFFLSLFSLYIFLFYFYYGKLGMMGNFAGWRNERGCTRYVQRLPDGTYQLLNKDARVKLYIHKAKPCILFCLVPCPSVPLGQRNVVWVLGCSCCSLVAFFYFLQKVSG